MIAAQSSYLSIVMNEGQRRAKKTSQGFLRRFVYYAKSTGESQMTQNLRRNGQLRLDKMDYFV